MYRMPGWLNCVSMAQRCKKRNGADGTSTEEGGFSGVAASRRAVSRWLTEVSSGTKRMVWAHQNAVSLALQQAVRLCLSGLWA
jgi:hypothetical protein